MPEKMQANGLLRSCKSADLCGPDLCLIIILFKSYDDQSSVSNTPQKVS